MDSSEFKVTFEPKFKEFLIAEGILDITMSNTLDDLYGYCKSRDPEVICKVMLVDSIEHDELDTAFCWNDTSEGSTFWIDYNNKWKDILSGDEDAT